MKAQLIALFGAASLLGATSAASAAAPAVSAPAVSAAKLSLTARAGAKSGKKSRQNAAAVGIPLAIGALVIGIAVSDGGDSN